jgi:hypothetical protein
MSLDRKRYFYVNPLEVWPEASEKNSSRGRILEVYDAMQDLRALQWNANIGGSSAGMVPKCSRMADGNLFYYKTSEYAAAYGFYGISACIEVFVSRLLDILKLPHTQYQLVDALIIYDKREHKTKICASKDFRLGRAI